MSQLTLHVVQSEKAFVDMLGEIRSGRCSPTGPVVQRLQDKCGRALDKSDGILPTKVWCRARALLDQPESSLLLQQFTFSTVLGPTFGITMKCCCSH